MRIKCQYNYELDIFLKQTVYFVIENYAYDLDLSNLKEIELVSKQAFKFNKDGEASENGTKIIVTSRLYEELPCLNINKLYTNNKSFQLIMSSLYHEMVHISDWRKYPNLYLGVQKMVGTKDILAGLIWLEYLAEKKSQMVFPTENSDFCNDFVKREWKSIKFNYEDATESNFIFLLKMIPYFMARTLDYNNRLQYSMKIKNLLLRDFIMELRQEFLKLEKLLPFDDTDKLSNLYKIMDSYFIKFKKEFMITSNSI